jgi:hypothetical protein
MSTYPTLRPWFIWARIRTLPDSCWSDAGCHYDGDPVVQLRTQLFDPKPDPTVTASDNLVPDLMILPAKLRPRGVKSATSLFCIGVPCAIRICTRTVQAGDNAAYGRESGLLALVMGLKYVRLIGRSMVSTTPREHAVIGSDQYVKCTSPLRRYGDLLLHWQVETALRHEAETGKSLVEAGWLLSCVPTGPGRHDGPRVELRERLISAVKRNSVRHWSAHLLFRAFYFNEAPLPETWNFSSSAKAHQDSRACIVVY